MVLVVVYRRSPLAPQGAAHAVVFLRPVGDLVEATRKQGALSRQHHHLSEQLRQRLNLWDRLATGRFHGDITQPVACRGLTGDHFDLDEPRMDSVSRVAQTLSS